MGEIAAADLYTPVVLGSKPGIKRDGTVLEGDYYVDGKWCRFQRGKPRKMGGYRALSSGVPGIPRGIHELTANNQAYMHIGSASNLSRLLVNVNTGLLSPLQDRTPVGFAADPLNQWMFDGMYDTATSAMKLIAHAVPNLGDLSSTSVAPVYIGNAFSASALTAIAGLSVCGGIVVLHPFLFAFCSNGLVLWSDANEPTVFGAGLAGSARVSESKVIKGLPLRGGPGNAPAGLFWTLNSLVRCTFAGGSAVFNFDTISDETSIISSNSPIEYDGVYYWVATDRFQMFNGVVRDLPNDLNMNWFFDNLNQAARNKVFALKVPRFGEIWWCFPFGSATECTHAVVFNVREGTWYDTELPNQGRSSGFYAQVFPYPVMGGVLPGSGSTYKIWQHEFGTDEQENSVTRAVQSHFTTGDIFLGEGQDPKSKSQQLSVGVIEPDFVQSGEMNCYVLGQINARAPSVTSQAFPFSPGPSAYETQQLGIGQQRRQLRFKFESNVAGGNYQMGNPIAWLAPSDGDRIS